MKMKLKRAIVVLGAVCLLCITVTACTSKSETETTQENENASAHALNDADGPLATAEANDPQAADTGTDGPQDAVPGPEADNPGDTQAGSGGNSRWHVLDPETAKAVDADLEGTVRKTDQDTFFISVDITDVFEDGSMLYSSPSSEVVVPDSDLLQVVYTDNTRFYIRNIYNNGASYEDEEATSESLEPKQSVSLKGTIEEDVFYADEVRISIIK